jgi:hypothetical protein
MDFWKAILGLVRRKLLILPLLAGAVALGLAGYFLTPLKYTSSTTMVLITPTFGGALSQDPAKPTDLTNPMLNFSSNLKTASAILIHAMNTPEVAVELGARDGPTEVTIDDGRTNPDLIGDNGPFVYIAGESTSRAEAKDVVIRAQRRVRQELIDRQKALGAPPETYVTLVDVVAPATPEVDRTGRIKVGGIGFVFSFFLGLGGAYAWQRLRARRPDREAVEPRREAVGPPVEGLEGDLHWSWNWDTNNGLEADAEESSDNGRSTGDEPSGGGQVVARAEPDVATAVTRELEPTKDAQVTHDGVGQDELDSLVGEVAAVEPQVGDTERYAEAEHVAFAEQGSGGQVTTDGAPAGNAERVPEPEPVDCAEDEVETVMHWNLYFADYPPGEAERPAPSLGNDNLEFGWDWDLDALGSERISR